MVTRYWFNEKRKELAISTDEKWAIWCEGKDRGYTRIGVPRFEKYLRAACEAVADGINDTKFMIDGTNKTCKQFLKEVASWR